MSIRSEGVAEAKKRGLCTQCWKNKVQKGRLQCRRCLDTNRMKQRIRAERNNVKWYKDKLTNKELCPTCHRALPGRPKTIKTEAQKKEVKAKRREYAKQRQRKIVTNKMRSLDKIKHAVTNGKSI